MEKQSAWQARRKRKLEKRRKEQEELQREQQRQQQQEQNYNSKPSPASPRASKASKSPDTPETVPDDEFNDPYESDPGESYRDHCERMEADAFPKSKSCLPIPKFLTNPKYKRKSKPEPIIEQEQDTALHPQSLPLELQQLKYSEQSEIGDGSQAQDWEARSRSLRPNKTHINISHWSDFGKRDYMEDR